MYIYITHNTSTYMIVYIYIYIITCNYCCLNKNNFFTILDVRVSSLRRGHAHIVCIVPILTDDPRRESKRRSWSVGTTKA